MPDVIEEEKMKTRIYQLQINYQPHTVTIVHKALEYIIAVDDVPQQAVKVPVWNFFVNMGKDVTIDIDGVPVTVAIRRKWTRFAVDGYYLDNHQPFFPARPVPKWYWIFFALNMAIIALCVAFSFYYIFSVLFSSAIGLFGNSVPVFTLLLPLLLSIAGTKICGNICSGEYSTAAKVIMSVITTLIIWGLFYLYLKLYTVIFFISFLFSWR